MAACAQQSRAAGANLIRHRSQNEADGQKEQAGGSKGGDGRRWGQDRPPHAQLLLLEGRICGQDRRRAPTSAYSSHRQGVRVRLRAMRMQCGCQHTRWPIRPLFERRLLAANTEDHHAGAELQCAPKGRNSWPR
eukprot:scaffold4821_cov91-Isochrysis_galbana.AAC.2